MEKLSKLVNHAVTWKNASNDYWSVLEAVENQMSIEQLHVFF